MRQIEKKGGRGNWKEVMSRMMWVKMNLDMEDG